MSWMAWTVPTALFFAGIFTLLAGMLVWERISPTRPRRGLLPLVTTRGDRLFIGLIATAFVHLAWLGLTDLPVWPVSLGCVGLMLAIGRWG
jgi:predicted small integral membrane protein